jgi:hypothetical protein
MASGFHQEGQFFEDVIAWRSVWFAGRLGGGKTLAAVAVAKWLLDHDLADGVWTNFPCRLPASKGLLRCVFIIDEAWQFLDARVWMTNAQNLYGAWARHMGSFWLFPSIFPPDNRVRLVTVKRTLELIVTPMPMWWYEYKTLSDDKGGFMLQPDQIWSYYMSGIPTTDGGVKVAVQRFMKERGIELVHDQSASSER